MAHQIRHLIKPFITDVTFIRPFISMSKNMISQIPLLMKSLSTEMATVRLHPGMSFPMGNQSGHSIKRLLAYLTNIRPLSRMNGSMLREGRHLSEGLPTSVTLKLPLISVSR